MALASAIMVQMEAHMFLRDVEPGSGEDRRFRSTFLEAVLKYIGDIRYVEARKGRVPETFVGLETERFAFVLLDMDVYPPTRDALRFFYPRLSPQRLSDGARLPQRRVGLGLPPRRGRIHARQA